MSCIINTFHGKLKSGAVVKHQRILNFVVSKATSNAQQLFESGVAPLYCFLVTSLSVMILLCNEKLSFPIVLIRIHS